MVFVVRRDLGWHKQKLAVMTAHAALALFKKVYKSRNPALLQWVRACAYLYDAAAARSIPCVAVHGLLQALQLQLVVQALLWCLTMPNEKLCR
jgi:hypothetical protein